MSEEDEPDGSGGRDQSTDRDAADAVAPEEAFAALGNERRVVILRVLAAAERNEETPLSFSDLYDRVGVDSSSQFAYHLDRLTGAFVRKSADGYALTHAGDRVTRAILSGTYTERPSFDPTPVDGTCPDCGATGLLARYDDPALRVACDDCGATVVTYDFSPAEAVDRTPMEALRACDRRVRHEYAAALDGVCPACDGLADVEAVPRDGPGESEYSAVAECRRCHYRVYAPLEVRLLHHPAVVAFLWERGVDATAVPFWNVVPFVAPWSTEVTSTDPFRARVVVRHGDDELAVVVDDGLDVTVEST